MNLRNKISLALGILILLNFAVAAPKKKRQPNQDLSNKELGYKITGDCDGYPKINVATAKGFCAGLLYSGKGLTFPRGILALSTDKILVVDMGGWDPFKGKLHLLEKNNKTWELKTILKSSDLPKDLKKILDRPHFVNFGPNKEIWIGSASTVYSIDPLSDNIVSTIKIKIDNLPFKDALHPLKTFTFDNENNIFVNVGSRSDNCEHAGIPALTKPTVCAEVEENNFAHIRKYKIKNDLTVDPAFEVYGKGLRNSMSLAWNDKLKVLFQGENSRDAIQKNNPLLDDNLLPHEELNLIAKDHHYGWPYCYDNNQTSPEFKGWNCEKYQKPLILLPPHSAPLGMIFYEGSMFPNWYKNKLIIALHGYREKGHRLVVFENSPQGYPTGEPLSLIYNWEEDDLQKMGSPVAISSMNDGSLLISEDKSKKILRLFYSPEEGDGIAVDEINKQNPNADKDFLAKQEKRRIKFEQALKNNPENLFLKVQAQVLDKHCSLCHGTRTYPNVQFLKYDYINNEKKLLARKENGHSYVVAKKPHESELILRIMGKDFPIMPPSGIDKKEKDKVITLLTAWINSLKEKN